MKKKVFSFFMALVMLLAFVGVMPNMKVEAANTADSLVEIAKGELGSTNYKKYYGGNAGAWCADFVTWCAQQAGVDSITNSSSCYYMYKGMTETNHCQEVETPQKGDIVFFYCNKCSETQNKWCHVGIVIDSKTSIDGNYSGKVSYDTVYNHNGSLGYKHGCTKKIYVRPNYKGNVPPTWAVVSLDKYVVKPYESVTFNLSSDTGGAYTVGIDDANGNRIDTYDTTNNYYTRSFDTSGKYSCYITTYNEYGLADSERIYFTVCDSKPKYANVSLKQNVYRVNENVTFNLSSDTGGAYTVGIDDASGNRIDTYDTTNNYYTRSFDGSGNYSCYITAYNEYGLADSERIYFTIYDSKPKYANVSLKQNVYQVGENVTFNLSSDSGYSYTVGIDDANGNRIDTYETKHGENYYTRSFYTPGKYSCYITTYNECGLADSERIYFTIYDSKPSFVEVSTDKNIYFVGEKVTFNLVSDSGYSYTIGIDDADGKRIDTYETIHGENYYTRSFDTPGNYSCYITTYNSIGLADSKRIVFKVLLHGDLNQDNNINVSDVVYLQKYLVKYKNLTSAQLLAADMNSDNKVNVFDMVILKRRIMKG
ncbi:MAG: dockerin type I domain-containing protein [Clostridium sp.]|nr:dockerin type I domain-containing protein [Clostridium sp.]